MQSETFNKVLEQKIHYYYDKLRGAKDGQEVNTILSIIGILKQRIKK